MLKNDVASAESFVRLGNQMKLASKSGVMVSKVGCSMADDGFEFRLHYGLPDISGYAPNLEAFAKTIPFKLSFLAEFLDADSLVDTDMIGHDSHKVVTLDETWFRNFWRHTNYGKTPVMDLLYHKEGVTVSDLTMKELSELKEENRPVNVIYFPTEDGKGACNLAFAPSLNGDETSGYTYVRSSKYSSKADFTFDAAPIVILCEVVENVGHQRTGHDYLCYIPPRNICIMSADEILLSNNNFFVTNGSIYMDAAQTVVIVSSGKPFPILEVKTEASEQNGKSTWVPPVDDNFIGFSVEESDNSKPDTEWLEKLLEQHSEDDYEDDYEDDDWFEPDYNTESFIFDEDADF